MFAVVKTARGPGNVELREVPEPIPSADQVKLEIDACGICGTDLHVYHDTFRNFPPVILRRRKVQWSTGTRLVPLRSRKCVNRKTDN